jgi:cullin 1
MTHISECTIWADSLIRDCFGENEDYISARDKVLQSVASEMSRSSSFSMLATQMDEIMRTLNAHTENSSEQRMLNALMTIFRFLEDKESFLSNYTHFLALRLMIWRQLASDVLSERMKLEKQMIEHFERTCGSGYVGLLKRMLADVENENENAKELLSAEMSSEVQVMILAASWPQAQSGWKESIWPEHLRNIYRVVASNYLKKFSDRKLEWFPELSTVTVKMGYSLVTLSVVQYSFLELLLQKGSRAPIADCLAYFDIKEEVFGSLIHGLTACGLIYTNDNEYFINEEAVDKFPPRIDLALAVRSRIPQHNQPSYSDISALNQPIDYNSLVQCHLVSIIKKEGKEGRLLKSLLFEKTKDALPSQFTLLDLDFEAQLKILVEKEYIEIDTEGEYIKYCP